MEYSSNIQVIVELQSQLQELTTNPEPVLRAVAIAVVNRMPIRIHKEGKDSTGGQIGTYSPGYMKVRTGDFGNAGRISRGPNKGKLKDAGTFTKKKVTNAETGKTTFEKRTDNSPRPKYNRTSDTTVVISLTRELENDYAVVPNDKAVGIGFNNPHNMDKARWVEETYKKPILTKLTPEEEELAEKTANEFTTDYLKTF